MKTNRHNQKYIVFYRFLALGVVLFSSQIATVFALTPDSPLQNVTLSKSTVHEKEINQSQARYYQVLIAQVESERAIDEPLTIPQNSEEVNVNKTTPLSLEKAIVLGINNNRQLAIVRLELERDRANLSAAKAARFPSFSTQTTFNRSLDSTAELQTNTQRDSLDNQLEEQQSALDELDSQPNDSSEQIEQLALQIQRQQLETARNQTQTQLDALDRFANTGINGSVGLEYDLYSPIRGPSIDIAEEDLRFRQLEVRRLTEDTILEITNAYYNLQQADREVEIAESDVQSRRRGANIVGKLLEASLATRLDLLNVEVELDNALQVLRNNQAQQEIARRTLADLLSLPSKVTPTAADPVQVAGEWDLALEETIILGFKNRVELEQQLAQRRRSEAERRAAYAPIRPQVSLFANYNYLQQYSDEPGDNALRGFGDGYSVGATFNWTPWDGGAAVANARGARANIAIAEQEYADRAEQIRLEIEEAYYQLPAALENIATANEALDSAEEAVEAANTRFRANLNTQTEVLDAQNRLIQAENNLVQAIIGHNRSLASLQRAVGDLAPSFQPQ